MEDAPDSVAQDRDVEIDQQASPDARKSHIGRQLLLVQCEQYRDRLDFDHETTSDNYIGTIGILDFDIGVDNRESWLAFNGVAGGSERFDVGPQVHLLEQARPERPMHPYRDPDRLSRKSISTIVHEHANRYCKIGRNEKH